jgi:hypothetical protein
MNVSQIKRLFLVLAIPMLATSTWLFNEVLKKKVDTHCGKNYLGDFSCGSYAVVHRNSTKQPSDVTVGMEMEATVPFFAERIEVQPPGIGNKFDSTVRVRDNELLHSHCYLGYRGPASYIMEGGRVPEVWGINCAFQHKFTFIFPSVKTEANYMTLQKAIWAAKKEHENLATWMGLLAVAIPPGVLLLLLMIMKFIKWVPGYVLGSKKT